MALLDIQTFNPPVAPSYSSSRTSTNRVDTTQLHNGMTQFRPTGIRALRSTDLNWRMADTDTLNYIESFIDGLEGGLGPFLWQSFDPHPSPTGIKPKLESVFAGTGTFAARDYYVAFTFKNATTSQETMVSGESSISLLINTALKVTLPANINGAESKAIYLGTSSGSLFHAADVTGRTWTQDASFTASSTEPPTSNSMLPTLRYTMKPGGVNITATAFGLYDIRLSLVESYI